MPWPFSRRRLGSARPLIAEVGVDGRRFRVTEELRSGSLLVGHVHPRRLQREKSLQPFLGTELMLSSETSLRFKVWTEFGTSTERGYVTNIEVVPAKQRGGWASSMIGVLLELYPACQWTVESPNEQSGQLFVALSRRHPKQIVPPLLNEEHGEDDPRRYSTNVW